MNLQVTPFTPPSLTAALPAVGPVDAARSPVQVATTLRVSVVLVNYRQWRDTARLLEQLRSSASHQEGAAEVVVVDNHSPGHPLARWLRRLPGVSLRRWQRNRGFARAVNEGARLSQGDWLLLLNPDMTLEPGFLDRAVELADRLAAGQPHIGVVGFGLRNRDGTPQASTGPFPSLAGTLLRLLLPRARRKYHVRPPAAATPVPWVTGCCMLIRRDCLADLGGLDPHFFLYYEDVDLCLRARTRGWEVWFEPALQAIHHQPLHSRRVSPSLRCITRHALLTYAGKHWPGWQLRFLAGIVRLEAWLRQVRARWAGDRATAGVFAELGHLAGEMGRGHFAAARRRLERIIHPVQRNLPRPARAPDRPDSE